MGKIFYKIMQQPDIFGQAALAYYQQSSSEVIKVHAEDFEDDEIPIAYLFRNYNVMPVIEQKALQFSNGKVLDVGCCVGSHALYLQNEKNLSVKAIDISIDAIKVARLRGIKNTCVENFFEVKEKYDTVLMLMNGIGIVEKLNRLPFFFQQLKKILSPHGKVLLDSSDLRYLFSEDNDVGIWVNPNKYYGELSYQISYKGKYSSVFNWLYIDFNTLKFAANNHGFSCKIIQEGLHYDYLAELRQI